MSTSALSPSRRTNSLRFENDDDHLHIVSPLMSRRMSIDYSDPIPPYRPPVSLRLSNCYVPNTSSDFSSSLPRCSVGKFRKEGGQVMWNPYNKNISYMYTYNVEHPLTYDPITQPCIVFSSKSATSIPSHSLVPSIPQHPRLASSLSQQEPRLNFDISTVIKHAEMTAKPLATRRPRRRFSLALLMRKTPEPTRSAVMRSSTVDDIGTDIFVRSASDYQAPPPKPKKHRLLKRMRGRKHCGQKLLGSVPSHSAPPPRSQAQSKDYRHRSCYSAPPPAIDTNGHEYHRRNSDLYIKFMAD